MMKKGYEHSLGYPSQEYTKVTPNFGGALKRYNHKDTRVSGNEYSLFLPGIPIGVRKERLLSTEGKSAFDDSNPTPFRQNIRITCLV